MLLTNPCTNDSRVIKEAEALAAAGHQVCVFCGEHPDAPRAEFRNGVIYQRLSLFSRKFRKNPLLAGSVGCFLSETYQRLKRCVLAISLVPALYVYQRRLLRKKRSGPAGPPSLLLRVAVRAFRTVRNIGPRFNWFLSSYMRRLVRMGAWRGYETLSSQLKGLGVLLFLIVIAPVGLLLLFVSLLLRCILSCLCGSRDGPSSRSGSWNERALS